MNQYSNVLNSLLVIIKSFQAEITLLTNVFTSLLSPLNWFQSSGQIPPTKTDSSVKRLQPVSRRKYYTMKIFIEVVPAKDQHNRY